MICKYFLHQLDEDGEFGSVFRSWRACVSRSLPGCFTSDNATGWAQAAEEEAKELSSTLKAPEKTCFRSERHQTMCICTYTHQVYSILIL